MRPVWFWLAAAPFFLNDFGSIRFDTAISWLANDYLSRLIPLALIWWLWRRGEPGFTDMARGWWGGWPGWPAFAGWSLALAATGIAVDQLGPPVWKSFLPASGLGGYPVESGFLVWFDLTFGLGLVALSEEVVFRAMAARCFAALPAVWFYLATSLLFGAAHWSSGLPTCVGAALIGCLFMVFYRATGLLGPLVAAHFAVNFVDFSGLFF